MIDAVIYACLLTSDEPGLSEVAVLCRRIVEEARAAGLRIGDNDNW